MNYATYNNQTYNRTENNYIFNEGDSIYYNPITDNSITVDNWYYDYSDRSYHLTIEEGDNITVTYGDEYVTIQEGDQTYNVYYVTIIDSSGPDAEGHVHNWMAETTTSATCTSPGEEKLTCSGCNDVRYHTLPALGHEWVQDEVKTDPTCTLPGSASFTCSRCGETDEHTLPATGHTWTVKTTVQTKYDDTGQLLQEGFTLYECSVCGEQYKDTSGTGPPGSSSPSGSGGGGSGSGPGSSGEGSSFWEKIKDALFGALGDLLEAALSLITDVLSAVLGLVKDLLSFFFGFLSDTVIKGITDLFSAFGSIKLELPEGVSSVFGFFSGVILALPAEIRSLLIFGVAALFLISIFKLVKA